MGTLSQPKVNTGLLVYRYMATSRTVIVAAHITSYKELPNNELLVKSGADSNRLKFIDQADRDDGISMLDTTMS